MTKVKAITHQEVAKYEAITADEKAAAEVVEESNKDLFSFR